MHFGIQTCCFSFFTVVLSVFLASPNPELFCSLSHLYIFVMVIQNFKDEQVEAELMKCRSMVLDP